MIVDVEVYILKRKIPRWLLRWFFIPSLIRSSAPAFPRVRDCFIERHQIVSVSCPECQTSIEVQR